MSPPLSSRQASGALDAGEAAPAGDVRPPRHVAIIMDGNGRWAERRGLPRNRGHREGVPAVRRIVKAAGELGIEYLTLFAFSSENWVRPAGEVRELLGLLRRFVGQDLAELHEAGVRVRVIGGRDDLAPDILKLIEESEELTRANTKMTLIVAFNYGARNEIAAAARRIAEQARAGIIDPADVTPALIEANLETAGIPAPDLLVRTSGERRLSNFLLWQCAYTELVFVDELWPDFTAGTLKDAIAEYHARERRFGGVAAVPR